jgi:putative hydrolase of the HAD superfamily
VSEPAGPPHPGTTETVGLGLLADWPSDVARAAADGRVVIIEHDGEPVVLANRCPHRDLPLEGGWVTNGMLTCPAHFWRFSLANGDLAGGAGATGPQTPSIGVPRYPAQVVDGRVVAQIPVATAPEPPSVILRRNARSGAARPRPRPQPGSDPMDQTDNARPGEPSGRSRPYDLLLLDFGGVCLLNPVELHHVAERRLGLPPGTFDWRGPIDPSTDPLWEQMVAGDGLTERDYWAQRAAEVGRAAGQDLDTRQYMELVYVPPQPSLIRPGCTATVAAAREAGMLIGILTNDLEAFHGPEWGRAFPVITEADFVADCSTTGILKPDPRSYQRALDMAGVPAERTLFVDDQPRNVTGAEAVGIAAHWFDIARAEASWADVAERAGLAELPARADAADPEAAPETGTRR